MKTTEEKSEMRVSAGGEQTVRERLLTLDDDRKKAVDVREAIAEIRRNLRSPKLSGDALPPIFNMSGSQYVNAYPSAYKYSTNEAEAPSMPATFGFDDSIT